MTIKEMEERLGMPRANIRYYEQEGLISPRRMENGYRDYGEEDVRTLEKVKLLRALGCSMEEIRQLKDGQRALYDILSHRSGAFAREMEAASQAREICEAICVSGEKFSDLDAKKYLSGAWKTEGEAKPIEGPKEVAPRASLWRRFWARMLDIQIYTGIWSAILCFVWPASQYSGNSLWTLAGIAAGDIIMIALEPLMLHFFGTTPGKWALGLRVHADGAGRLSLKAARARTRGVLWHGLAMNVPVIEIRTWWKRYKEAEAGEPMYWEDESYIEQRGRTGARAAVYIALRLAVALVLICCMGLGRMPVHRGMLTPEEFAENYNRLTWAYGVDQAVELQADGTWREKSEYVIRVFGDDLPQIEMETENGAVCGASMRIRVEAGEEGNMLFLPVSTMQSMAVSLVCAESPWYREMLPIGSDEMKILRFFEGLDPRETKSFDAGSWQIEYGAECSGGVYPSAYEQGGVVILPQGEDGIFEMEFSVRRK